MNSAASIVSGVVLLVVVLMRRIHLESSFDFSFLPPVYSAMNALSAVILLIAYWHIKNKECGNTKNDDNCYVNVFYFSLMLCFVSHHYT
ncbi:MAG: hypothetical protein IPG87_13695 [Saprospiraceae bacterium]|nr:hypothetical protein [Candidatus Vicinibacter affinis]